MQGLTVFAWDHVPNTGVCIAWKDSPGKSPSQNVPYDVIFRYFAICGIWEWPYWITVNKVLECLCVYNVALLV